MNARWKLLGTGVVAGAIWFGGPRVLNKLEFFRIRRVELIGTRYLDPEMVVKGLLLGRRSSVFDDLDAVARRAARLPGVESAEAGRRLPGTLVLELRETEPVALVPGNDRMRLVDPRGRLLPYDPAHSAPDVPVVARPDSVVAGVLARIRGFDPGLFARVATAWRVRDDVVLELDGRRLWFSPNVSAEDIRAVMAVAQDLARQGRSYQELDGRFAGQVVVRGTSA